MNLTGLIQKSGSLVSSLPQIRNESDILNIFLMYLSKQSDKDILWNLLIYRYQITNKIIK